MLSEVSLLLEGLFWVVIKIVIDLRCGGIFVEDGVGEH